jgi:molecular chaperone GrpE
MSKKEKKEAAVENVEEESNISLEIEKYQKEIMDLKHRLLSALAETENVRKRLVKEKEDVSKYCISSFARDILPIRDTLLLAIKNSSEEGPVFEGIKLTMAEIDKIFEKNGVTIISATGQKFDPNVHQAVFDVPDESKEPGVVVEVVQEGFLIKGRLLRPALVGVSKKCN